MLFYNFPGRFRWTFNVLYKQSPLRHGHRFLRLRVRSCWLPGRLHQSLPRVHHVFHQTGNADELTNETSTWIYNTKIFFASLVRIVRKWHLRITDISGNTVFVVKFKTCVSRRVWMFRQIYSELSDIILEWLNTLWFIICPCD